MNFLRWCIFIYAFSILQSVSAQTPNIPAAPTFKLFLIGDAGEGDTTGATLRDLKLKLEESPNSAVVFLGDNCYVRSLWGLLRFSFGGYDGSIKAQKRIMAQLNTLRGYNGYAYFIPGNHDWWNHTNMKRGKKRLLAEQKFIEDSLRKFNTVLNCDSGTFLPTNGDPGPVFKEFNGGKTRIIFIDTYRLIVEEWGKPGKENPVLNKFYKELKRQLTDGTNKRQKIIVVAHHPIHAKGKHSLPLVMLDRLNRRFGDSNTNFPPYNRMATRLDSLLKEHNHPDIYYVSGHEHSLEYFFNDSLHYLISGAGSKVDKVTYKEVDNEKEYLIWNEEGFFEIDFYGRYEKVIMYHRKDDKSELKINCLAGCN